MTENAQNPAATNPSNADLDYGKYLPAWTAASHIQLIVQNLPLSTYTDDIQKMFQSIQDDCSAVLSPTAIPGQGQLGASDATKRIATCAQQLKASANPVIAELAQHIIDWNQDLASPSGA